MPYNKTLLTIMMKNKIKKYKIIKANNHNTTEYILVLFKAQSILTGDSEQPNKINNNHCFNTGHRTP